MTPTKPEDALVELTPRQIAEKIAADARMRLICMKPDYDTIDMGEALIQRAITTLLERERRLTIIPVCGDPVLYVDGKRICKVSGATDEGRLLMSLEGLIK